MSLRTCKRKNDNYCDDVQLTKRTRKSLDKKDYLSSLPIELKQNLIEYLQINDKLNLRLVNKHYKNQIEIQRGFIESLKVKVCLSDKNLNEINDALEFVEKMKKITFFELKCPKPLKTQISKQKFHENFKLKLHIPTINIKSLQCINIFSKFCEDLEINEITQNIGNRSFNSIMTKLGFSSDLRIKVKHVKHLKLNFNIKHKTKNKEVKQMIEKCSQRNPYINEDDSSDNSFDTDLNSSSEDEVRMEKIFYKFLFRHYYLKNNIKICSKILGSLKLNKNILKVVELENYNGNLLTILKSLKDTTLEKLILRDSCLNEDLNEHLNICLKTKHLELSCPYEIVNKLLTDHIDLEYLEDLHFNIFYYKEDDDFNDFSSRMLSSFNKLNENLRNLRVFNAQFKCFDVLKQTRFKFPSSLVELNLGGENTVYDVDDFIKDWLQFKDNKSVNFKFFETSFFINCECQNDIAVFKSMLKYLVMKFLTLEMIKLTVLCDHTPLNDDLYFDADHECLLKTQLKILSKKEYLLNDLIELDEDFKRKISVIIF